MSRGKLKLGFHRTDAHVSNYCARRETNPISRLNQSNPKYGRSEIWIEVRGAEVPRCATDVTGNRTKSGPSSADRRATARVERTEARDDPRHDGTTH